MKQNTILFSVGGMSCQHCKASVEKALKTLDGVKEVRVNLEKSQVYVEFDPEGTSAEALQQAIGEAGYEILS